MKTPSNARRNIAMAMVLMLTFAWAGFSFASDNNNGGGSVQTPDIKIKEFREGK